MLKVITNPIPNGTLWELHRLYYMTLPNSMPAGYRRPNVSTVVCLGFFSLNSIMFMPVSLRPWMTLGLL